MVLNDSHINPLSTCEKDFTNLFHKYYQTLCSFAYNFLKSEEAAEDVVIDSFAKLWQQEIQFAHPLQVKTWLYRTVRNNSISWLREQQRLNTKHSGKAYLDKLETEEYKLQQIIHAEVMEEIYAVINTLPKGCYKVFTMFYFEGKPLKRIAEELNLSVNTIKSQKARSLDILREKLPPLAFIVAFFFLNYFAIS